MESIDFQKYITQAMDWSVTFVPKVVIALLVLWIGFKIVKRLDKIIEKALKQSNIGPEIEQFLGSILEIILKGVVILIAASMVGIKVSALFGMLAAAGFAVGLALQGFLGNFASGLTIIFFKPYRVGDWVSVADDTFGKVESIKIFNTELITPNEKVLIVPNGKVTDSIITNYSTNGRIRLELNVTMPYSESFPKVKSIISNCLKEVHYIMQDPEPLIGIESYDSHNIILSIRPFINPDYYWDATYEVYEKIKNAFQAHGIQVAYSEGVEMGSIGE